LQHQHITLGLQTHYHADI